MVTVNEFKELALNFEGATAAPHFHRIAFKTKKTFATLDEKEESINVVLTPIQQSVYATIDSAMIFPVDNKWGLQGWTTIQLALIERELLLEIVSLAYENSLVKNKKSKS